jgi:hypothetical protein
VGGLIVLVSPVTYAHRAKIADLGIKNRLAAIAPSMSSLRRAGY